MAEMREVLAGRLRFLEDLLWEWIVIQERAVRLWDGEDALWWYNERASLGGFAGAVWRVGGVVLEEYSTEKSPRKKGPASETRRAVGRGDMAFMLGGKKFVIEAKQCWPRLGTATPLHRVEKALAAAEGDVRRSRAEPDERRLALVFAAPGSLKQEALDTQISAWVNAARVFTGCARAWVFPAQGRRIVLERTGRIYPGAGVFVKSLG